MAKGSSVLLLKSPEFLVEFIIHCLAFGPASHPQAETTVHAVAESFAECTGQEMCILDSFFAISRVFKLLAGDLVQHIAQSLLDDIEGDLVTLSPA
jgi:hypothetical protein